MTDPTAAALTGVVPVLPTPFTEDEEVDRRSFAALADHVMGLGVPAVMFPGFASEYYKLDDAERLLLSRDLVTAARAHPGVTVIASVTAHATSVAVRQARAYLDLGAGALNVLPPHFPAPSADHVREHLHTLLAAVAPAPVLLQYAPEDAATRLTPAVIGELAAEHPNLVAVKVEARPPGQFIADLRAAEPAVACLAGSGGLFLLEALRAGACGVQPGSSFVELYLAVWRAWSGGDERAAARRFAGLLPHLVGWATTQEPMVAVEKVIAWRRGLIATPVCRRPHRALSPVAAASVERFLAEFADELSLPHPVRSAR
ncbi:dihydrodipicolinate synthase family protein [Kitasatospora sp. NA04385]|uniref:dihydrodipicolinate synthase family protein n=1 Tax=Kitasatospora sp. NA04385 TaxID=2742135 RepID=UPI00158FB657|nr:dihydrodipicolinate synthase family protein [Kitasatospora sp. NA04385]QKW17783.1 dihydrodipicolinate synthase family protein [Kitasatospora sp. NA04385]